MHARLPHSIADSLNPLRTIISIISVTCIVTASFITVIATGVQPDAHLIKNGKPIVWYTFNRDATLSDVVSTGMQDPRFWPAKRLT